MEKFVFLICLLWQFSACVWTCNDMKKTIEKVSACPRTEAEWNIRAAQKNCAAMCQTYSYHCLITKDMDATIEVCAEAKYIQGYCTYFDVADDRIKGLYAADCSTYSNPCPTRYYSTEAYKYQACYDLVREYVTVHPSPTSSTPVNSNTLSNNLTHNSLNNTSEDTPTTAIVIAIVVVLVIIVVISVTVTLIRWGKCPLLMKDTETGSVEMAKKGEPLEEEKKLLDTSEIKVEDEAQDFSAEIQRLKEEYEAKLAEVHKEIEVLKTQTEKDMDDKEKLKRQVLEKNKECKTLNNRLQEAKGNIRVLCRIRKCENSSCLSPTKTTITINKSSRNQDLPKKYQFERVFDENTTQEVVYEEISELIRSFLDGYNLCIFAYGQTGSGKTYTMEGPQEIGEEMKHQGIIPRAMEQVFSSIADFQVCGWTYQFHASYFELYNEEIRNLAKGSNDEGKNAVKSRTENTKTSKTNITEKEVKTTEEVMKFYKESSKNRTSAKTARNERSSRSHAIFRLAMKGKVENIEGMQDTCSGTLTLVDLAGSERLDDSAANSTNTETKKINLSLLELTKVLRSLRRKEIPIYRNSKLTYLLQESLGGNSKTLMIVNVSPSEECQKETERTLEFGREVSKVVLENVPRKNK